MVNVYALCVFTSGTYTSCVRHAAVYEWVCMGHTGVVRICIHVNTQIRKNGVLTTLHI